MNLWAKVGWKHREPTYRNALKALGSAVMGGVAIGVCLWFLAPEYKMNRHLAADGIIANGVVESAVKRDTGKRRGRFNLGPVFYDLEVQGPDYKVEFKTERPHKAGDAIVYVESPTLSEIRELSPGVTRDQVFGELSYTKEAAGFIALLLFGVVHTGREILSAFGAAAGARRAGLAR